MSTGYKVNGVDLSDYLQPYFSGSETPTAVGYKINGTSIAFSFAGRDNDPYNAPTITTGYQVNGVDIATLFNKSGASLTVQLSGGSTTYNGQGQQAIITKISPTDSWITVTTSTKTNAGTYNETDYTYTPPTGYTLVVSPSQFIISPRTISIAAQGSQSFTYNGTLQYFTAYTVSNAVSQDTTYSVSNTVKSEAGSYTAILSTTSSNYTVNSSANELTWSIAAKTISIAAQGSSSLTWTGNSQTFGGYNVSGNIAQDSGWSVSGRTQTNCGSYTVTLTASSSNYTVSPTAYQVAWTITPTTPANFTASVSNYTSMTISWTAVGGCNYTIWQWNGSVYVPIVQQSGTSYTANGSPQNTYYYYVEAYASSGTSTRTSVAAITCGQDGYFQEVGYDSGNVTLQPLCLSGSADGRVGLKSFVQGTYGITVSQVGAISASCNFSTSQLWNNSTRIIRWNLNGTSVNFPRSTDTSAPNPWNSSTTGLAPYYRSTVTTGTVTYCLVATGTGWSTNNSSGVSGIYWASVVWRNQGTALQYVNPVNPSISYF